MHSKVNTKPDVRKEDLRITTKNICLDRRPIGIHTSDLPGKKQCCQKIDWNFRFPFIFDIGPDELQFLSLFFQLAAGQSVSSLTQSLNSAANSAAASVQTQVTTAIQQAQTAANATVQNVTQQLQAVQTAAQIYAENINASTQQATDCLSNAANQSAAIINATQATLQQQTADVTAKIIAIGQNFASSLISLASNVASQISNLASLLSNPLTAAFNLAKIADTVNQIQTSISSIPALALSAIQNIFQVVASTAAPDAYSSALTQGPALLNQTVQCLQNSVASATPAVNSTAETP